MTNFVQAQTPLRGVLVGQLVSRTDEICDEIQRMTEDKIERVRLENIERGWIRASTRAHLDAMNHLLVHPEDLASASPPVGAASLVRDLARQGMPLHEIIRSYQLSSARWYQICTRAVASLTDDVGEAMSESAALADLTSSYLDRMCELVAAEYEDERERWLRQAESVRLERVLAVLNGALVDPDDAERALGYRLRQNHQSLIAWIDPSDAQGGELLRAQQAVKNVTALLTTPGRPFVVARDARTVWAWIPQPVGQLDALEVEKAITVADAGARIAIGEPATGSAGFVRSHRQASAAFDVGHASTVRAAFPYRDVSVLAFLVSEPERARSWTRETLGLLAGAHRREDVLRRTLMAFLRSQQSATVTSRELNCHKNTVVYRLRTIEQLLGHAIESEPISLGLALQAYEWLGATFFE